MTFDEHKKKAPKTDLFYKKTNDINSKSFITKLLGLAGETGEESFRKV